ncbi:dihydroxyacetone kinase subunit DhaK [Mangrovibacter phragmitis]|uniref:dihydroxyacetone kinase subunit DhaK n=1 Tax=Mangrovibacter phragmitis TaxID=1691903 RepID=UPI00336A96E0
MNKLFINNKDTLVDDSIEGAIYCNKFNNLTRLEIDPKIRVVCRNDWNKDKVALVCGGGSGHEPAHVGFIGRGMLTAAVCGDVFASPSVDAVLNAIVNVTGEKGCLVIVKNYTGDRLNFGLACEKAKKMGYKVEMVIVDDDISIEDNPQPRGIAGTVFVHKVAGHAAEQGKTLEDVKSAALSAIQKVSSIGVAITSCTLPGDSSQNRIAPGEAELGLGIHGEPGVRNIDSSSCKYMVDTMVEQLYRTLSRNTSKVAVMINNLGGVSPIEMGLITKNVLESKLGERTALILGPSTFMTALDMKGFSISCLELDMDLTHSLLSTVEADAWIEPVQKTTLDKRTISKVPSTLSVEPSENAKIENIVRIAATTLVEAENELNALDSLVGDGDTGTTFAAGAKKILAELEGNKLPLDDTGALFSVIGEELSTVMGGSSGVLLSIMFTAAGNHYNNSKNLVESLQVGLKQMMAYGGASLGDCTMIDAIHPALEAWKNAGLEEAIIAVQKGADSTASMTQAKAGRSSYLNSETLKGVKDPGSAAVELVFLAFR